MHRLARPLVAVLAIPVLSGSIALAARSQLDDRWQAGLRREFLIRRQQVNEQVVARLALGRVCSDPRSAAAVRPCGAYNAFYSMASASWLTCGLGLALLAGIAAAGRAARGNRHWRARLFRVGIVGTAAGLVVLVLLHGALGVTGLLILGQVVGRWPSLLAFAVVVGAILVAASMIQVALAVTRTAEIPVVGRTIEPGTQPRLAALVSETAVAVSAGAPDRLLAGLVPGVFVTEARLVCLDGPVSGRTLYLSLPLARILSAGELRGLIAHELAHFSGDEAAATSSFMAGYASAVRSVRSQGLQARGIRRAVVLPALSVVSYLLDSFASAAALAAAGCEAAADQAAAETVGREVFGAALVKVHAFASAWDPVRRAMAGAAAEGTAYRNASELFAQVAGANAGPERLAGAGSRSLSHPTGFHRPLAERLSAVPVLPAEVAAAALDTRPPNPAIQLLDGYESIEQDLSQTEHRVLAAAWAGNEV